MNTPPMLLGAALLFWGWQTGMLAVAAVLACILEGARIVDQRWHFSQSDLNRIWNLCAFLFIGAFALAIISDAGMGLLDNPARMNTRAGRVAALNKTARAALLFFQWLPLVFFPVVAAQAYGASRGIKLSTFSWILRRRAARDGEAFDPGEINVSFPYFGICLVAASTSNERPEFFFPGTAVLLLWALWSNRLRRFAPVMTAATAILVCAGGYMGTFGMRELQRIATALDTALLSRFSGRDFNPRQHRSLLGAIGRVKGSGKIVLWVTASNPPPLLREAAYEQFSSPVWHTTDREFNNTLPEEDQTTWKLRTNGAGRSVNITRILENGGRGLLPFPGGAFELRRLPLFILHTNTMAVLKADGGPRYVSYDVFYAPGAGIDRLPSGDDERVPPREAATIAQIAGELNLPGQDSARAVEVIQGYFQQNFTYSTYLESGRRRRRDQQTPIGRFLLETRKGHCEYFAAATVLLLRQAGIPARYAVGYSVQEGSAGKYVVRDRHAHAWALAWLDGRWTDIDTTPPSWNAVEASRAPWWEPLDDFWSNVKKQISRLRWSGVNYRKYFIWGLAPAVAGLAFLVYRRRQWTRLDGNAETSGESILPGLDSEFYLVERRLGEFGFHRRPDEALGSWIFRINGSAPRNGVPLEELLRLHYRYRFDPSGLEAGERQLLKEKASEWVRNAVAAYGAGRTSVDTENRADSR